MWPRQFLGADIGTTVTTQLIAFKLTDYALLMIAIGFCLGGITRTAVITIRRTVRVGVRIRHPATTNTGRCLQGITRAAIVAIGRAVGV